MQIGFAGVWSERGEVSLRSHKLGIYELTQSKLSLTARESLKPKLV